MKIFKKYIAWYWLITIVLAGVLTGATIVQAVSPIWSNQVAHTFTYQSWVGTATLAFPSTSSNIGQSVTLTATLNPLPTQYQLQQNVTFYYSDWSNASSTTPFTGNAATGLDYVGGDTNPSLSTILTTAGVATLTFTPLVVGTFYFIAVIGTPT
jgi:hypothetical protein